MKNLKKFFYPLIVLSLLFFAACSAGLGFGSDAEITSYSFLAVNNDALSADVVATISGSAITASLPEGTDLTALIADYEISESSAEVSIGESVQASGVTSNDFTLPLTYSVSSEGGITTRDYVVSVSTSGDSSSDVFVSASIGNDSSGDGTRTSPYATIAKGITEATSDGATVRVGRGIYSVSEPVEIVEGVSLYGGYDEGDWSRDIDANATEIESSASGGDVSIPVETIMGDGFITSETIIDGFTIRGPILPEFDGTVVAIFLHNKASPMISNNRIEGGESKESSLGILLWRADPIISNNIIESRDLMRENGGSVVIVGVGSPWIMNNTISAGTAFKDSAALSLFAFSGVIDGNAIDGGEAGEDAAGILLNEYSIEGRITNNTIRGGDGGDKALGIKADDSSAYIENNTISSGVSSTGMVRAIEMRGEADIDGLTIINNIIFTETSAGDRVCIYEGGIIGEPRVAEVVDNNDLYDCPTAFYEVTIPAPDDHKTIAAMETYLTGVGEESSGNVTVPLTLDSEFRIVGGR